MKKADKKRLNDALDKALAPPRRKPQANLDALLDEYDDGSRPTEPQSSPVRETSLVKTTPQALSETRLTSVTSLVSQTTPNLNLAEYAETLEYTKAHLRINHIFFDKVICELPSDAQLLLLHLHRYREGDTNMTVRLNLPLLHRRTGLSVSTIHRVSKVLDER